MSMVVMSYKYKEEILSDIGPETNCNYESDVNRYYDKINELEHVYAQAAEYKEYRADTEKLYNALKAKGEEEILKYKAIADEYEAKAEAFDEVMDLYVNGSNKYLQTKRHTLDVFIEDVAEILKPFTDKYESGESE